MTSGSLVLVVDDDENDLRLTVAALCPQTLNADIVVAHDGQQALDYLRCRGEFETRPPRNPSLVILDLNMPRVDGLEVLSDIKMDARLKTIPIIVFTSSPRQVDVWESYQRGANAYVVKPLDHRQFADAVRAIQSFWLDRNQAPSEALEPSRQTPPSFQARPAAPPDSPDQPLMPAAPVATFGTMRLEAG